MKTNKFDLFNLLNRNQAIMGKMCISFMLSLLYLAVACSDNGDCPGNDGESMIRLEIFPKLSTIKKPILVVSEAALEGEIEITLDGKIAEIDSIVPSKDSLLVIIPDDIKPGSISVSLNAENAKGEVKYEIVSEAISLNYPITSPNFLFPNPSITSPLSYSINPTDEMYFVNVYDPEHLLNIVTRVDDDLITTSTSFEIIQRGEIIYESPMTINGSPIWWDFDASSQQDTFRIISDLSIKRDNSYSLKHPYAEDLYRGTFMTVENFDLPPDFELPMLKYYAPFITTQNFLILTSQQTGLQFLFVNVCVAGRKLDGSTSRCELE